MKHLYVATPTFHFSVTIGYCTSILMTMIACTKAGIVMSGPDFKGGPYGLEENRNWLVHRFLKTDADTILFLDDDICWDEKAVVECYESGFDVCGGCYPRKQDPESWPITLFPNQQGRFREAAFLPGGFLMVRRHVFGQMRPHLPWYDEPSFGGEPVSCYFETVHVNNHRVGEDIEFGNRWRRLGGKVWCLTDIDFEHQGPKAWKGNLSKSLPPLYEVKEEAA